MSEDSDHDDDMLYQKQVMQLPLEIISVAPWTHAPNETDTPWELQSPLDLSAIQPMIQSQTSEDLWQSPDPSPRWKAPLPPSTPPGVLHTPAVQNACVGGGTAMACAPPGVWHSFPGSVSEAARTRQRRAAKFQCYFLVGIEEDPEFRVVFRIIGAGGANVKAIAFQTGAKLRLRGRGTNFVEGSERKVSTDDLMVCVSALNATQLAASTNLVRLILENVYAEYDEHLVRNQMSPVGLRVHLHYGPRKGAR